MKRREFADICHVTPGAITGACRVILASAVQGKFIDADHPVAVDYIARAGQRQREYEAGRLKTGKGSPRHAVNQVGILVESGKLPEILPDALIKKLIQEMPKDVRDLANFSLRDLISRFGTAEHFQAWLKSMREMERIHKDKLANAQTEGVLVNRELVRQGVLEPLDTAHIKLLTDGVKKLVVRLEAMQAAGKDRIEREKWTRATIGKFIAGAKKKSKHNLGKI